MLLWTMDSDQGRLVLNAAYALVRHQVPQSSSSSFKVSLGMEDHTETKLNCSNTEEVKTHSCFTQDEL